MASECQKNAGNTIISNTCTATSTGSVRVKFSNRSKFHTGILLFSYTYRMVWCDFCTAYLAMTGRETMTRLLLQTGIMWYLVNTLFPLLVDRINRLSLYITYYIRVSAVAS